MTDTKDLLPCPFCGAPPVELEAVNGYPVEAWCDTESCIMNGMSYAIEDWNTRAPAAAMPKVFGDVNKNMPEVIYAQDGGEWVNDYRSSRWTGYVRHDLVASQPAPAAAMPKQVGHKLKPIVDVEKLKAAFDECPLGTTVALCEAGSNAPKAREINRFEKETINELLNWHKKHDAPAVINNAALYIFKLENRLAELSQPQPVTDADKAAALDDFNGLVEYGMRFHAERPAYILTNKCIGEDLEISTVETIRRQGANLL